MPVTKFKNREKADRRQKSKGNVHKRRFLAACSSFSSNDEGVFLLREAEEVCSGEEETDGEEVNGDEDEDVIDEALRLLRDDVN